MNKSHKVLEIEEKFGEPLEVLLKKMYVDEKKSTVEIGELFGMDNSTVGAYLKKYDIQSRTISDARLKGKHIPTKEELIQLYIKEKKSSVVISELYSISDVTIRKYLEKYKIPIRTISEIKLNGKYIPTKEELTQLYINERKTQREIAELYGIKDTTIGSYFKKYGIQSRAVSDSRLKGKHIPTKEELMQLYVKDKKSMIEISRLFGINSTTICNYIKRYKIPTRNNSESQLKDKYAPTKNQLIQMYVNERKSTVEIAKLVGLSSVTITTYLKRYKIPIRTISETMLKGKYIPTKEKLTQLYIKEGKSTVEIGEIFGIDTSTIGAYLKKYSIPIRTASDAHLKGKHIPSKEDLIKLYVNEKKSSGDIAELFNITDTTVRTYLKKYHISIRNSNYTNKAKKEALEQAIQKYVS